MDNARDDLQAIETATDLLVRGLNRADISSITDLVTDTTMLLPPARRTSKGRATVEFWRNLAIANEGIRMLSTDMDTLSEGLIRDVGTLRMRLRQSGEQRLFRYMVLWQKIGDTWTIATMAWNREAPASGRRRPDGDAQSEGDDEI